MVGETLEQQWPLTLFVGLVFEVCPIHFLHRPFKNKYSCALNWAERNQTAMRLIILL